MYIFKYYKFRPNINMSFNKSFNAPRQSTYFDAFFKNQSNIDKILNDDTPVESNDLFKIVLILDESGSMDNIREKMLHSINDLIKEQKQIKDRPATFTLVKFNDGINRKFNNSPLENVNFLTPEDYVPSGTTALYDAIGSTINWFRNEKDVLMVIITDGQENASKKYNKSKISEMIDDKQKNNNWSYVYLSCDLGTFEQGNNIGLQKSCMTSNCVIDKEDYGDYIAKNVSGAISKCRRTGETVQSQLNSE